MKAFVYRGPKDIRYDRVDDPQIVGADDLRRFQCGPHSGWDYPGSSPHADGQLDDGILPVSERRGGTR